MSTFCCPTGKWNKNKLKAFKSGHQPDNAFYRCLITLLSSEVICSYHRWKLSNIYCLVYEESKFNLLIPRFTQIYAFHIFSLKNMLLFWKNPFIPWIYFFWVLIHMCSWSTDNIFKVTTILEANQRLKKPKISRHSS